MSECTTTTDCQKSAGQSNNNRGLIVATFSPRLNQISHVHGHLFNGGPVVFLNVLENSGVVGGHEVDSHTLSTEATASANPGNGEGLLGRVPATASQ